MAKVYFGGSRNLQNHPLAYKIVRSVLCAGSFVHVGCQFGADQLVTIHATAINPSSLVVFAVSPTIAQSPAHVQLAAETGARVVLAAGGESAPIKARYLLRSIAAFQGCRQAVFFSPGPGSLAVARECVKQGLQVFAFQQEPPAPIPSCRGQWCISWFRGFQCWAWGKLPDPQEKQMSFI